MTTLASISRRNALLYGDKQAFVAGDASVTFAEHNQRVNRLIRGLQRRGFSQGDRTAILARNCLPYFDLYGMAEKSGFVLAPLNFRLSEYELVKLIPGIGPRMLFAQECYAERIDAIRDQLPPMELVLLDGEGRPGWMSLEALMAEESSAEPEVVIDPGDVCYMIGTSGTTGDPKAAMHTQRGQWLNAIATALEFRLGPDDRHLAMMPLFHIGGWADVLAHTMRGCTVVLHDGFDTARVFLDIERHAITTTQLVPTMLAWMMNDPALNSHDLSSLRLVFYASAPMPVELLRRALDHFGPIFMQAYGQTESGPLATTLQPEEHGLHGSAALHLSSCGRAVPGVEVRIVADDGEEQPPGAVGEIALRSPWLMTGYWQDPAATSDSLREGWLHTGDMGRMDDEGYVYLVDRKRDMIISGGENVFPREVEETLCSHPAVLEAAVIGMPDDVWGEAVTAVVALHPGHRITDEELIAYCRVRLAGYKCPKRVQFRDDLPKNATGKILKRALREHAQAGLAGGTHDGARSSG